MPDEADLAAAWINHKRPMTITSPQDTALPDTGAATTTDKESILVICEHCDWRFSMRKPAPVEGATLPRCPHCYHSRLNELSGEEVIKGKAAAELLLPFEVTDNTLHKRLQSFAEGIRFAPLDLTPSNLIARLQRVFLPMWLVDTDTSATWEAEMGFDYEVVSHQANYGDQRGWDTREVKETRIRWEPRLGNLNRSYQNISAPALEDHARLQASLGAFDLRKAAPYKAGSQADAAHPPAEPES